MKYDDDQCERCGGVNVNRSTLCVDCLVKERDFLDKEILMKDSAIKELRRKLEIEARYLEECLDYGFKRNQENIGLHQRIMELMDKIEEDLRNGKGRDDAD